MPILTMKALSSDEVIKISKELVDELEATIKCPREYFTLEITNSTFVVDGEISKGYPIVDISWFDRGQEIQDEVAKIVTKHIGSLGYDTIDVIFHSLEEKRYYENGEHF